ADISREMELDELRKLRTEVQSAAHEFESSINKAAQDVETGVRSVETQLNEAGAAAPAAEVARASEAASPAPEHAAAPVPTEPAAAGAAATPTNADAPRQNALPGFDRI
ncbi:MAG TPA: hypothetical protein VIH15_15910, partial [Casimicrobiaceae bacterium]